MTLMSTSHGLKVAANFPFVVECSWLDPVRQNYLRKIQPILTDIDVNVSVKIISNQELLMQLLMDDQFVGA